MQTLSRTITALLLGITLALLGCDKDPEEVSKAAGRIIDEINDEGYISAKEHREQLKREGVLNGGGGMTESDFRRVGRELGLEGDRAKRRDADYWEKEEKKRAQSLEAAKKYDRDKWLRETTLDRNRG